MHKAHFPLFETIAIIEGKAQNLALHEQRYMRSLQQYYGINLTQVDFSAWLHIPAPFCQGLVRCRIDYNQHDHQVQYFPYQHRTFKQFQPVICDNIDYALKFSQRNLLEQLYAQRQNADEILIIKQGLVTDCSIGNLLFKRQGQWFTPKSPLLQGTQREKLLQQEKIQLRDIPLQQLDKFEEIRLINALNPFEE